MPRREVRCRFHAASREQSCPSRAEAIPNGAEQRSNTDRTDEEKKMFRVQDLFLRQRKGFVSLVLIHSIGEIELSAYETTQGVLDFFVPGNRRNFSCSWVLVEIMPVAVPLQSAPGARELSNELTSFQLLIMSSLRWISLEGTGSKLSDVTVA